MVSKKVKTKYPKDIHLSTQPHITDKRINSYSRGESNPHTTIYPSNSYYHYEDNNYQKAVIEGFKLLSSQKLRHPKKVVKSDQELCKTLVLKYGLNCLDCKLKCEMHEFHKLKSLQEEVKK